VCPQVLLMGAGECIFLQRLRTISASAIPDFIEFKTDSGLPVSNPYPSTEASTKLNAKKITGPM
jgi:hypothetical protein